MRINLYGQRNPLGGGVHFSGFCDALKAISCLSPAISEYDYFSEADFSECMKSVGHDDVNIHFINYTHLDSAGCPNKWRKLPGSTSIGLFLRQQCSIKKRSVGIKAPTLFSFPHIGARTF